MVIEKKDVTVKIIPPTIIRPIGNFHPKSPPLDVSIKNHNAGKKELRKLKASNGKTIRLKVERFL